jgi:hypothetical protein
MVDLGSIGKGLGGMVTSQEGKDQAMKFISSPEGMAMLQQFVGSPQGKELAGKLLMPILGNLGVPDSMKQSLAQFVPK